jgi:hypothetical protein
MKKNLFLITEEEKNRILGMHMKATKSQYLSEAGPFEDDQIPGTNTPAGTTQPPAPAAAPTAATPAAAPTAATPAAAPTAAAPTAAAPTAAAPTAAAPESQIMSSNDRDYAYKKEGDKYYFKLQPSPVSSSAQNFMKQGKFVDWTAATGGAKDAIAKLNFKPETMQTLSAKDVKITPTTPQNLAVTKVDTAPVKPLATGGGGQKTVTAQTSPQVAQDLKSASQIRQEFRQGNRDLRKLQRERDKLYNTYNRLSGKMDKATDDSYIDAISKLDQLISQK